MPIPPIFQLCSSNSGVTTLLGTNPTRLYPFSRAIGSDGKPPAKPYAVWQNSGGSPENYLAGRPDADSLSIQIDVYGNTVSQVEEVADAIKYAIELNSYIVGWYGTSRDPVTDDYRFTFQADFIVDR